MLKMRDYRSRKRLAELKLAIYSLKERKQGGELSMSGEAEKIFFHALKIAEQI